MGGGRGGAETNVDVEDRPLAQGPQGALRARDPQGVSVAGGDRRRPAARQPDRRGALAPLLLAQGGTGRGAQQRRSLSRAGRAAFARTARGGAGPATLEV